MGYLLGVDAGTTSMKAILIDEKGNVVCTANTDYNLITQTQYQVELEANSYWEAFKTVTKTILKKTKIVPEDIIALAVDSQGETLICLDKYGEPLRKAIVWLDNRSTKEAEEIAHEFDIKEVFEVTGQPEIVATWPATKIMWIKKHEKRIFDKTDKYLLVADYINFKLTEKYVTDKSLISSTLYFNIQTSKWWKNMLDFIGIEDSQLPTIQSSGVQIGKLTEKASIETGLSNNTIVVTGALDQMAGAIGSGNIKQEIVTESTGTCLAMCVNIKGTISYSEEHKIPCHYHALPDEYCLLFWSQTAGAILEWFKNNFYVQKNIRKNIQKGENTYNEYQNKEILKSIDLEAGKINPGSDGLILLPHFSGSAVPHFNPNAKGVFFGVALEHGKGHFSRAIMESVGFMLREHIEMAESFGSKITEIRSLGGGAKSSLWNQIKADITGKEIVTLENPETASLGSAILAGVSTGVFVNYQDASNKCIKIKDRYYPNKANIKVYEDSYNKYKNLYKSISHLY